MITLTSLEDREIYNRIVPEILLDQDEEQVAQEWARHQAIGKVAGLCLTDQIDPDQFLDGCFDALGRDMDPFLDEIIIGLSLLANGYT